MSSKAHMLGKKRKAQNTPEPQSLTFGGKFSSFSQSLKLTEHITRCDGQIYGPEANGGARTKTQISQPALPVGLSTTRGLGQTFQNILSPQLQQAETSIILNIT